MGFIFACIAEQLARKSKALQPPCVPVLSVNGVCSFEPAGRDVTPLHPKRPVHEVEAA